MRLAMIGLGRMGGNMSERLIKGGHEVVVFDRTAEVTQKYAAKGATPAATLAEVTGKLKSPRVVWIMVPSGKPVDDTIAALAQGMSNGDVIIDGGNSNFHDTMRRGAELQAKGVKFNMRVNHGVTHSVYINDPNGYGVELLYELPREMWEGDIDAGINYFQPLPTEGEEALKDDLENAPSFGRAAAE